VVVLHHEGKYVAVFTAAETVEELPLGVDRKGRRLFAVEGAQPGKAGTCPLQLDIFANHLNDIGGVLDSLFYMFTGRWNGHNLHSHRLFRPHPQHRHLAGEWATNREDNQACLQTADIPKAFFTIVIYDAFAQA
jgi:hypothetical protein